MYAPKGYKPLAEIWTEFVSLRRQEIYDFACKQYITPEFIGTSEFGVPDEFGSPKDLLEQTFIETVRPYTVTLCSFDGLITSLPTNVADGSSDIFERALVFESTITNEELKGNEDGREWLTQMGSAEFAPWPHKIGKASLWAEAYPVPGDGVDFGRLWNSCKYHRLPTWFERHRFAVSKSLPPWASDVIDTAFAKSTAPSFLGWSMCLDDQAARKWRSQNIRGDGYLTLLGQIPINANKLGRPSKREAAIRAYDQLYPDGNHPNWKAACQAMQLNFNLQVSVVTLQRALKARQKMRQNTK